MREPINYIRKIHSNIKLIFFPSFFRLYLIYFCVTSLAGFGVNTAHSLHGSDRYLWRYVIKCWHRSLYLITCHTDSTIGLLYMHHGFIFPVLRCSVRRFFREIFHISLSKMSLFRYISSSRELYDLLFDIIIPG